MTITWWEYEDLLEHLRSRDDIWTRSDENEFLWLRTDTEAQGTCALLFTPPSDATSPFRLYSLQGIAISWEPDYVEAYLRSLLDGWTSFRIRQQTEQFLVDELHIDPETASLSAIALMSFDCAPWAPHSEVDPPTQQRLYADALPPMLAPQPDPLDVGTWLLSGGGYVKLRYAGEQLRCVLSIPSSYTGGYGPPLEGFVRPHDGRMNDTVAFLQGRKGVERESQTDCPEPVQLEGLYELSEALRVETPSEPGTG